MKFKIVILPAAERDVDRILNWLIAASASGAASWLTKWDKVLDSLKESAAGCGLAPEDEDHELVIQQVIFKTRRGAAYRAIFTIRDTAVYILHVRGPGQNILATDDVILP